MLSSRPAAFNLENQAYPLKTPRRGKSRVENDVPTTTRGLGKVNLKEAALRTPFRADTQLPHKALGTSTREKSILVVPRTISRPLGDKTPFPNRTQNQQQFETPGTQPLKPQVLSFLELQQPQTQSINTPPESHQLRPSSARKQDRVPRSGSKSFETPLNTGNYWDVSESSIVLPEVPVQEKEPEDDYDEIEYMPPNTLDLAYQPPFDFELPDYKEAGKTLFKLAHSYPYEDITVAEIEVSESDVQLPGWDMLSLPELESDDPFVQALGATKPAPPRNASSLSKERTRTEFKATKPATSAPKPPLRPSSTVSKPNTTMSSRPGTASSLVRPAKPTNKPTVDKPVRSVRPLSTAKEPQTNAKPKATTTTTITTTTRRAPVSSSSTLRPAAGTTTTTTSSSRSASSAAATTRSRTGVTAVPVSMPSTRRPATAASLYKTTIPSTTTTTSKKVGAASNINSHERCVGAVTKKTDLQARSSDTILFVETPGDDDDFRFDV